MATEEGRGGGGEEEGRKERENTPDQQEGERQEHERGIRRNQARSSRALPRGATGGEETCMRAGTGQIVWRRFRCLLERRTSRPQVRM
eukprot:762700-Hanusia_phi.AAC.5